jgi:hypothetical protein
VTPARAGAIAAAAVLTLGACGTTYYDATITVPPTGATTTTTLPPVDPETPVRELLTQIASVMEHLDEQIVDASGADAAVARIDELWAVADPKIRDSNPDDLFPFQQAIQLAHSGVERRRPADASKGYRLLVTAIKTFPA